MKGNGTGPGRGDSDAVVLVVGYGCHGMRERADCWGRGVAGLASESAVPVPPGGTAAAA